MRSPETEGCREAYSTSRGRQRAGLVPGDGAPVPVLGRGGGGGAGGRGLPGREAAAAARPVPAG